MDTNTEPNTHLKSTKRLKDWVKKTGVAGFTFFLIKGLIWLAVFLGLGELF